MANIFFTCLGSLGDLYPYLSVAKALERRGHHTVIASSSIYKQQIEAEGLTFAHIRSELDQYDHPDKVRDFLTCVFDPIKGGEFITRTLMARIDETYEDTFTLLAKADLVISNPLSYATPIACRERQIPWLSTVLAPMFFLSTYDPPHISAAPWLGKVHQFSPGLYRFLFKLIKMASKPWCKPLYHLCKQLNIDPPEGHPLFEGQYSPHGTLAMFPFGFGPPQPDWPANTHITGFPLYSAEMADTKALRKLDAFLTQGEPPIVFALGSSAVNIAGDFYRTSTEIARRLNKRAVLVCGQQEDQLTDLSQDENIFVINYVAYDKLFPKACLIVHQGGIGTLAQSVYAEKPVLVVPFGFDQFDNGERVTKLGIGRTLSRENYKAETAMPTFKELLSESKYAINAEKIVSSLMKENGTENACDVIEQTLGPT